MVFASLEFLTLFLPLFLAVYVLTPKRGRNFTLLLGSWAFYSWLKPIYLLLLVAVTIAAWGGALLIEQWRCGRRRKLLLVLLMVANVGILCWYKYANILVATYNDIAGMAGAIPLAWSVSPCRPACPFSCCRPSPMWSTFIVGRCAPSATSSTSPPTRPCSAS